MSFEADPNKPFPVLIASGTKCSAEVNDWIVTDNYDQALHHLNSTQLGLILLEIDENTPELIDRIRAPESLNISTPLIALTADDNPELPVQFDGYLKMPCTKQPLLNLINDWQTKTSAQSYIRVLLDKTKNNRSLALTIFKKLFEELSIQTAEIKCALDDRQFDSAKDIVHKLNGSVSFCGFSDIYETAYALEKSLINNLFSEAQLLFPVLERRINHLIRNQNEIIAELS